MPTQLLQRAVKMAESLPDHDQDSLAAMILAEMEDEARWTETFRTPPDTLKRMALRAKAEHQAGESQSLAKTGASIYRSALGY